MAKKRKVFQIGLVLVILIGFPLASWYYMYSGLQLRKETNALLNKYGTLALPMDDSYIGTIADSAFLKDKVVVVSVFDAESEVSRGYGDLLYKLHDQFDNRQDVLFVLYGPNDFTDWLAGYELSDEQQIMGFQVDDEALTAVKANFERVMPVREDEVTILLADSFGEIRRVYLPTNEDESRLLVEHIATLMPKGDRPDIERRVETEK